MLPPIHQIKYLSYTKNEQLGNAEQDRKAIFDLFCESESGEKFIVEVQKAKQNFFKDRSVYYSTFPIQEQAKKGNWNFKLSAVYTIESLKYYRDLKNVVDTSKEEGEQLKSIQIAKEMKADGFSVEKIEKYTGLSRKEIQNL